MIKNNKLVFFVTAFSLVSSAAVFAIDRAATAVSKSEVTVQEEATAKEAPVTKAKKFKKKKGAVTKAVNHCALLEKDVNNLKAQVADLQKQQEPTKSSTSWSKLYAYGPAIVTTPIIGMPSQAGYEPNYSGYDLYVNFPSINEDIALLHFNQKLASYYKVNDITPPERPIISLSGEIEGQALNSSSFNDQSHNDINLSAMALEAVANVSSWITGLVKIEYSDFPPETGARVTNSVLKVKRAYITVGNLDKFPIYTTTGQMYLPFGVYSNWMTTLPLTYTLGKMQERALLVGFNKNKVYGSVYAFEGDSYKNHSETINSWGANLGYTYNSQNDVWSFDVGAGYVANIADTLGMQDNGTADSTKFAGFKNHELLVKQIPAADVHALFTFTPISIAAEYVSAIDKFDKADLTFNDNGAKPRALDIEGVYNFKAYTKPAFVSAGYGQSWESLGINIPKNSYFVSTGISLFRNTAQSIEYRHDINYGDKDIATSGSSSFTPGSHTRNIVTASFRMYF